MSSALLAGVDLPRHREEIYLQSIARRELPPIILLAGKSDVTAEALYSLRTGCTVAVVQTELNPNRAASAGSLDEFLSGVIYSNGRSPNSPRASAILLDDLVEALSRRVEAVIIPVGEPNNIPAVFEAIRSYLPLAAIGSMVARNPERSGVAPGDEAELGGPKERENDVLRLVFGSEQVYVRPITKTEDAGLRPANQALLRQTLLSRRDEALNVASTLATRVLTPVQVTPDNKFIPSEVIEVLDGKLLPTANEHNLELIIKGGVAVAMMLRSARQVSLDIDYTVLVGHSEFTRVLELTKAFVDESEVKIQAQPGMQYSPRSTKISGKTGDVEIDAVPVRRVVREAEPPSQRWVLEFKYGRFEDNLSTIALLPSGSRVSVIPAELAVAEKLVAGRGPAEGKFDLYDSAGIIATRILDHAQFQRYIHRQRFKEELDPPLALEPITLTNVSSRIAELGIEDAPLRNRIVSAVVKFATKHPEIDSTTALNDVLLTPDVLKQLVLIDAMLRGLHGIDKMVADDAVLPPEYRIKDRWGAEVLEAGIGQLKTLLYGLVETETIRPDIYVKRTTKSAERSPVLRSVAESLTM